MNAPDTIWTAFDATWPAGRTQTLGPWTLRFGRGGGNRVTAASRREDGTDLIDAAADAMRARGQTPLFRVPAGQPDLDRALAERGFPQRDETDILTAALPFRESPAAPGASVVAGDAPLAIARQIWGDGGIGPDRVAIMARVTAPKRFVLARIGQRPAGTAFAARHGTTVFVHAMEVRAAHRRGGAGAALMAAAAHWGNKEGARQIAVAVTHDNEGARALYARLGLERAAQYHYRREKDA